MDLPGDDTLRDLVTVYARVRAACGDALAGAPLVQPNSDCFPDAFVPDAPSVARLLRRVVEHSPLSRDLHLELAFVMPDEGHVPGGCGSAACGSAGSRPDAFGTIEERDGGYCLSVSAADVPHPVMLTTALARGVGWMVMREAGVDGDDADPAAGEIAAAACGLGILIANGAAVWAKSCGGLRMAQATALSVEEAALALALDVAVQGHTISEARRYLEATQREALDLAEAWVESNPWLVETLRDRPDALTDGRFAIEPPRGPVGRWLRKRQLEKDLAAPREPAPAMSEEKRRRLEEARALVDESFSGAIATHVGIRTRPYT
jgi:hypothetical protein